jgi:hypothetical protein
MKHATKRKKGIVRRLNRKTNRKLIVGGDKIDDKLKILLAQLKLGDIDKNKFEELFNGFCETLLIYIYDRDKKKYTRMNIVHGFIVDLKEYMNQHDPKDARLIDKHIDNIIQLFRNIYLPYILKMYQKSNPNQDKIDNSVIEFGIKLNNDVREKYKTVGFKLDDYFTKKMKEEAAAGAASAEARAVAEAAPEATSAAATPLPGAVAEISSQNIMDLVNPLLLVNKAIDEYDQYTKLVKNEQQCSTSMFHPAIRYTSAKTVRQCTRDETIYVEYAKELIKQRKQISNVMENLPKQLKKWIEDVEKVNSRSFVSH